MSFWECGGKVLRKLWSFLKVMGKGVSPMASFHTVWMIWLMTMAVALSNLDMMVFL